MEFSSVHVVQVNDYTKVYLLSYNPFNTELYYDRMTAIEKEKLNLISNQARKNEYVASRLLKSELFPEKDILYNSVGAPFLQDMPHTHISISHTKGMVGLAVSDREVGMDLEPVRDLAKRIHFKFVNEEELKILSNEDEVQMCQAWSAKEVLYKLAERKQIDFKKEMNIVSLVSNEHWKGRILKKDGWKEYDLKFFKSGANILTVNDGFGQTVKE
jgi:4'-phosphopantetheinyl transferase EntD